MATRIKYTGEEMAAPPADTFWRAGEERDIDDDDWAERLQSNPAFVAVKMTKAPPKPGEAPPVPEETPAPEPMPTVAEGS